VNVCVCFGVTFAVHDRQADPLKIYYLWSLAKWSGFTKLSMHTQSHVWTRNIQSVHVCLSYQQI